MTPASGIARVFNPRVLLALGLALMLGPGLAAGKPQSAPETPSADSRPAEALDRSGRAHPEPDLARRPDAPLRRPSLQSSARLPLVFEPNHGQADPAVKFVARGSGYRLILTPAEAVLTFPKAERGVRRGSEASANSPEKPLGSAASRSHRTGGAELRMSLVGSNPNPNVRGDRQLRGKVNYLRGNDRRQWRTGVPTYAQVEYSNVYPGIDLIFRGADEGLEYDFVLAPGADPAVIRLRFAGAHAIAIDSEGELRLDTDGGRLRHRKPTIYQIVNGTRRAVAGRYVLAATDRRVEIDPVVGFEIDSHDRTRPLVIDPVIVYSTPLGGSGAERARGIAADDAGQVYLTGETDSVDFPVAGAWQPDLGGATDVFVTKVDPTGSTLIYSTFIGGSLADRGRSIAIDAAGNAYVTGDTASSNFPANGFQANLRGQRDAFVAKLNPDGVLSYSTFLGGNGEEEGYGIAVHSSGEALVTGLTLSSDFPTATPIQPSRSGVWDAFVARLNATGAGLRYSTYLGGLGSDHGCAIAVDSAGNGYVTGLTTSANFPTVGAFQPLRGGGTDAFVTKINAAGSAFVYSSFLGGSLTDGAFGIAVDQDGHAYVTGSTISRNFPTVRPFQAAFAGGYRDIFVTKVDRTGASLGYSTYLGGRGNDHGFGIAVDALGRAHVVGATGSPNFPTVAPVQASLAGRIDAVVTQLNAAGTGLLHSTYLGGTGLENEEGFGIAVTTAGVFVTGQTGSVDFPSVDPLQPTVLGRTDGFLTRLGEPDISAAAITPLEPVRVQIDERRTLSATQHESGATLERVRGNTDDATPESYAVQLLPDITHQVRPQLFPALRDAGIRWARVSFDREVIHKGPGEYDWSRIDVIVNQATAHGVQLLAELSGSPPWDSAEAATYDYVAYPPRSYDQWGNYVFQTVSRYRGQVRHWEIWNEEDAPLPFGFWNATPAEYARLLAVAHREAKRADPTCQVVLGGLLAEDFSYDFFQAILSDPINPADNFFDVLNIHAYFTREQAVNKVTFWRSVTTKPLWVTEVGWPADPVRQQELDPTFCCGEAAQAQFVREVLPELVTLGADRVFWFALWLEEQEWPEFDTYGLLDSSFRPRLAYSAFRELLASVPP